MIINNLEKYIISDQIINDNKKHNDLNKLLKNIPYIYELLDNIMINYKYIKRTKK